MPAKFVGASGEQNLEIRLLGPVRVVRGGAPLPLPPSRKVRALLALLALEPRPQSRSTLCDFLWDTPNDPRGELRWCLSKLRGVLDDEDKKRVVATGQSVVALDLSDSLVDVRALEIVAAEGVAGASTERLAEVAALYEGDFLDGMQVDGPALGAWLVAQRQRLRSAQIAIVTELVRRTPSSFHWIEAWLRVAPFEAPAHEAMIDALVRAGRVRDAERHVDATTRAFEQEGVDWTPLRHAWHASRRAATSSVVVVPPPDPSPKAEEPRPVRHGSVVVMPFVEAAPDAAQVAQGLTDDIITRLAKLRVLFVIARGTTFALAERGVTVQEAGRILGVEYVVSGSVRSDRGRFSVRVELAETESARIVWTDDLDGGESDTFAVLDAVVDRVVASIAEEIESAECQRALLKPPSSLDAWEAYHRGLFHMYKFNGPDNHDAAKFFEQALRLDPTFARAHAGLSFTHFQNAFLDLTPDRAHEVELAFEAAGRSVDADVRDPAAHWAMGRALWLRGEDRDSFAELQTSIDLSPNFALGHYTLGFVHSQMGDPQSAIDATNTSRALSPFDPLQFAMLASRALAHVRLGELDEAADWAVKATGRPNAHVHILAIAVEALVLAERRDDARRFVGRLRERTPGYTIDDFLRAFRFDAETTRTLRRAAKQIGFDARVR